MKIFKPRTSLRLKKYNYSNAGYYFITICVHDYNHAFGNVRDGEMILNDAGRIVADNWRQLPYRFLGIEMDEFIIMPNYFHGIIFIERRGLIYQTLNRSKGVMNHAPTESNNIMNYTPANQWGLMHNSNITLGKIVRHFKAKCTKVIHDKGCAEFQWHRNYYDHIIRNEKSLNQIRQYIQNNPLKWDLDEDNPKNNLRKGEYVDIL